MNRQGIRVIELEPQEFDLLEELLREEGFHPGAWPAGARLLRKVEDAR